MGMQCFSLLSQLFPDLHFFLHVKKLEAYTPWGEWYRSLEHITYQHFSIQDAIWIEVAVDTNEETVTHPGGTVVGDWLWSKREQDE